MIDKTERKTIFSRHKTSAAEIAEIQRSIYDNEDLDSFENEAERNEYLSRFDLLHEPQSSIESFHKTISFDHSDLERYPEVLSKKLVSLFSDLNADTFFVISHLKTNFFGNLNTDHAHLKKGYADLKQIIGSDYYDEALRISTSGLNTLIPIIFWMQRLDASAPEYLFFFDEQNRFSFYICNYGKVHTIAYENELFTSEILEKNDWEEVDQCVNSLT